MKGLLPFLCCTFMGCIRNSSDGRKSVCSRCGRMDVDRERLLTKTLQKNRMLEQENRSHAVRIKHLRKKIKRYGLDK